MNEKEYEKAWTMFTSLTQEQQDYIVERVRLEREPQEEEWLGTKTVASDIEEYKKRRVGLAKIQVLTKNSFNYQRNSASLWIGLSLNYYQFIHQNPSTHFVYRCEARERLR